MRKNNNWFRSVVALVALAFGLTAWADNWIDCAADSFASQDNEKKTITIATAEQFALLAKQMQNPSMMPPAVIDYMEDGKTHFRYYFGWTITITADIDLSGKDWTPIGSASGAVPNFVGHVDGGNHAIRNLTVSGVDNVGLFSCIGYDANGDAATLIENLTIENANVIASGAQCGALVGQWGGGGKIRNVTVKNSTVKGQESVGGILGYGYIDAIEGCKTIGTSESPTVILGTGGDEKKIGGIAGFVRDEGTATPLALKDCLVRYVTLTGAKEVGGLLGRLLYKDATVQSNCVADVTLKATEDESATPVDVSKAAPYLGTFVGRDYDDTNVITLDGNTTTPPPPAAAKIGTKEYATLDAAIAAAQAGDVIEILASSVEIPSFAKSGLTFKGNGSTQITAFPDQLAVSEVTLDGFVVATTILRESCPRFTVRNCKFIASNGIRTAHSNTLLLIENCVFENEVYGINTDGGGVVQIVGCSVRGWNSFSPMESISIVGSTFTNSPSYGMLRFYSAATIQGCEFASTMMVDAKIHSTLGPAEYTVAFNGCSARACDLVAATGGTDNNIILSFDAGVDSEGRYSSGRFYTKNKSASIPLAADCTLIPQGGNVWQIGVMVDPGKGEKTVPAIEQSSDVVVNSNAVDAVVTDAEVAQKMKADTTVTGVKLTTDATEGKSSGIQAAVDKAKAENAEVKEALDTNASMVTVKVDVVVSPITYVPPTTEQAGAGMVTFDLAPYATVTVVTTNEQGEVESSVSEVVDVTNGMIDQNQKITVMLPTGFLPSVILHNDDNGRLIESFAGDEIAYKDGVCTIQISHFSQIQVVQNASYVAMVGGQMFTTLQSAFDNVTTGTVTLLKGVELTNTVTLAAGKKAVLDLAGKEISWAGNATAKAAGLVASAGDLTLAGGTLDAGGTATVDGTMFATCAGDGEIRITDGFYKGVFPADCGVTNAGPIFVSGGYFTKKVPAAFCAIGYVPDETPSALYGMYTVKDALVYIRNVAAAQRYPWNGYVDITFEMCMNRDEPVTLFVAAYYQGQRVTALTEVTWVGGEQQTVNVADGTFKVVAKTERKIHLAWNSNVDGAFPDMKADDITVKVLAK